MSWYDKLIKPAVEQAKSWLSDNWKELAVGVALCVTVYWFFIQPKLGGKMDILTTIVIATVPAVLTGLVSYRYGSKKFFKEQQQRVYEEALPVLLELAFTKRPIDEKDSYIAEEKIAVALSKIWLYASKNTAKLFDVAVEKRVFFPELGNFIPALQEAIAAMRNDIQPRQKLKAKEIQHLYINVIPPGTQAHVNSSRN